MGNVGCSVCCCVGAKVADGNRVGSGVCIEVVSVVGGTVGSTGPLGAIDSSQLNLLALLRLFLMLFNDFELFDFLGDFDEGEGFFLRRTPFLLFVVVQGSFFFPFPFFLPLLLLLSADDGAGAGENVSMADFDDGDLLLLPPFLEPLFL